VDELSSEGALAASELCFDKLCGQAAAQTPQILREHALEHAQLF
jgi:hypothetical protein